VVADGVLEAPRAADSFRVDSPRTVVLQADSMGLGFLLDPMVAIYDESGRRIAWQDEPTTCTGLQPRSTKVCRAENTRHRKRATYGALLNIRAQLDRQRIIPTRGAIGMN